MHRQLSLITCAHLLATALATHQHIHRSPLETSPFDANPRAANATNEVEVIVASAWFPSWSSVPLSELSWEKYTHMVFAFAYVRQVSAGAVADLDTRVTTTNPAAISVEDAQLKEFVAHARNNVGIKPGSCVDKFDSWSRTFPRFSRSAVGPDRGISPPQSRKRAAHNLFRQSWGLSRNMG